MTDRLGAPPTETDVLVIGGGVSGCSMAYYLAREGIDVLVIDRDEINTAASGRNAGSLHLQLMAFSFLRASLAERRGRQRVLPLFLKAVETWHELGRELDCDIELSRCGGLMVAETDEQMRFLDAKISLERAEGLDVEILTGSEIRELAPYLSDRVIGGEFCPDEGKLNPIRAIPALARGAERACARILRHRRLIALNPENGGFLAETTSERIRCRRVVNAAGAFSAKIAGLVGIRLPVSQKCVQTHITEPAPAGTVGHLVCHAQKILTIKQVANGNVIIGGGWQGRIHQSHQQPTVVRNSITGNLFTAVQMVPGLGQLRMLRSWAGINIISDGMPILGEVASVPGFFNSIPSDSGFTLGPVCARLVAEQIAGKVPSFDLSPYTIDRFSEAA